MSKKLSTNQHLETISNAVIDMNSKFNTIDLKLTELNINQDYIKKKIIDHENDVKALRLKFEKEIKEVKQDVSTLSNDYYQIKGKWSIVLAILGTVGVAVISLVVNNWYRGL